MFLTVMFSFDCQFDISWEKSLSEALSMRSWYVGCLWGVVLSVDWCEEPLWVAPRPKQRAQDLIRVGRLSWMQPSKKTSNRLSWLISLHSWLWIQCNYLLGFLPWLPYNHGLDGLWPGILSQISPFPFKLLFVRGQFITAIEMKLNQWCSSWY